MPIFDYRCLKCEYEFERLVRRPDDKVKCPECGDVTRKLIALPAFKVIGGYDEDMKI